MVKKKNVENTWCRNFALWLASPSVTFAIKKKKKEKKISFHSNFVDQTLILKPGPQDSDE